MARGPRFAQDVRLVSPRLFLFAALALVALHPLVSAPVALAGGVAFGLLLGHPRPDLGRKGAKILLQVSIVALGAGLDLREVLRAGLEGLATTAVSLAAIMAAGLWLGRRLGVPERTGILVSVGTAICGGSAIAAVTPVIRADPEESAAALGAVFVLNAVALFLFPPLGALFGLDGPSFGLLAALAIHDTSSVVGAASTHGPEALAVATTVKLVRALWIIPLTLAIAAWHRRRAGEERSARLEWPWFILGFLATAALVTALPALRPLGEDVAFAGRRLLVVALFFIGAGLSRAALVRVGARPFVHAVVLWLLVTAGTLAFVLWR